MAKNKKPIVDDEDEGDIEIEIAEPAPAAPARRRVDNGMVLDMEGLGGEVASAMVVNGLRAYLSVVNKGVNLVVANRAHTAFVPVRIEACNSAWLSIKRDEAKPLVEAQGVLAFLLDDDGDRMSYYLPVSEFLEMADDHGEGGLRLDIDAHAQWLEKYEGHAGVRRAFARLLN